MVTLVPIVRASGLAIRQVLVRPRDALLSARMAGWVVLVSMLARVTSLPRVQELVSVRVRSAPAARDGTAARLGRTIDSLLRLDLFVFRRCCWKRSFVLHRFLALNGIDSRINFGVQKTGAGGAVQGHAWLEHQGQPLLEESAGAYVVTVSLPRP